MAWSPYHKPWKPTEPTVSMRPVKVDCFKCGCKGYLEYHETHCNTRHHDPYLQPWEHECSCRGVPYREKCDVCDGTGKRYEWRERG